MPNDASGRYCCKSKADTTLEEFRHNPTDIASYHSPELRFLSYNNSSVGLTIISCWIWLHNDRLTYIRRRCERLNATSQITSLLNQSKGFWVSAKTYWIYNKPFWKVLAPYDTLPMAYRAIWPVPPLVVPWDGQCS